MRRKLIFEYSQNGKEGSTIPKCDVPEKRISDLIPENLLRSDLTNLPQVSEPEVVRHYTNLSTLNHHVDKDFYPLGSCTMKYNPKINEAIASNSQFTEIHPAQLENTTQGSLQIFYETEKYLCEITGMDAFTLHPSAGSHGELTAVMIMRKYHKSKGNDKKYILIPDSAHGTNPASVMIGGYKAVKVNSTKDGLVDIEDLKSKLTNEVAGFMLTNPNTLGIFEENVLKISELIHSVDGLMYMDGANMNALLGIVKTVDMGFDITHLNLHKTFSTPHGGGGPGSGPIGVTEKLKKYLPVPTIIKENNVYKLNYDLPESIGKVHSYFGHFNVILKAFVYLKMLGADGLKEVSKNAIINANYIREKLKDKYQISSPKIPMHECVFSGDKQKEKGVKTLDIAKRLLDYGMHAPTIYFPLIVSEALMIEPTETESKETLDRFIDIMLKIDNEIENNPDIVKNAPQNTPNSRLDEATASRTLDVNYFMTNS
ncbi:MAG: aminomethyl-transferring glycine dehydrogenase subunit GcvPB [Candidatus Marinimicrobia bacterium]|nr:aminomethyl-transferring glycine dehydrogenase subunit GcvPB [Candidatus Neomarinimicrobiota bacterium]